VNIYERLGVTPLINADARWTGLGGSLMSREVLDATNEAAATYVDINALQLAVGRRIAELTKNEAAYVSANATASIALSVLACITQGDDRKIARLPEVHESRNEILIHSGHRIPFDPAISLGCGQIVQFGNAYHTSELELLAAITERTAALFYVAGTHVHGALPLDITVKIAHAHNVPVVVDAAAQLPPKSNLWRLSREMGADLVIFSGGKDLGGPQASGLIVGRNSLIDACRRVGPPSPHWARALKTGKEEMVGLMRAVELYVERDEEAYLADLESTVSAWVERFGVIRGVTASRLVPNLDGQPTPRALITFDAEEVGVNGADLAAALAAGDPAIRVGAAGPDAIYLNPETLKPGEAEIVADRIGRLLAEAQPQKAVAP